MEQVQRTFALQFAHPRGPLGSVVASIMRRSNAPLNLWMIDRLHIQPPDRILEVGFGPGLALGELVARTSAGLVVGIDASELMVRRARSRYAGSIAARRLEVHTGDAGSLSFDDASFDTVCGTHVIYFWPEPVVTIRELRRVLRSKGTLALAYQERAHMPPRAAAGLNLAGAKLVGPGDVTQMVRAAGFEDVRLDVQQNAQSPAGFCVLATK